MRASGLLEFPVKIVPSLAALAAAVSDRLPELRERVSEATFLKLQSALNQIDADVAEIGVSIDTLAAANAEAALFQDAYIAGAAAGAAPLDLGQGLAGAMSPEAQAEYEQQRELSRAQAKQWAELQAKLLQAAPRLVDAFVSEAEAKPQRDAEALEVQKQLLAVLRGLAAFFSVEPEGK